MEKQTDPIFHRAHQTPSRTEIQLEMHIKSKKEIIDETSLYTTSTRAKSNYGCRYLTDDGRMCAVGRCIIPSLLKEFDTDNNGLPVSDTSDTDLEKVLQEQYRGHEKSFWLSIQAFHDGDSLWTKTGMSDRGVKEFERLHKLWNNQ